MRSPAFGTHPPRFDAPFDLDAHLAALPQGASAKGIFFRDVIERAREARPRVDLLSIAGIEPSRFLPFFDYPYADLVRLLVAASETIWPGVPVGEGLRRLGKGAYDAFLGAQFGKVIFGALGNDFGRIVGIATKGYRVSVNFGRIEHVRVSDRHAAFRFSRFPALIETYQVGLVEGAMQWCGVSGEVWVRAEDLETGVIEIFWDQ